MPAINLPPRAYEALQGFVARGHEDVFRTIVGLLGARPGDTVVEVGCGAGSFGRRFAAAGYDYWGFDVDEARVSLAARRVPEARFVVGDAANLNGVPLPPSRYFFAHGVLHHLSDAACRLLIDAVMAKGDDVVFVASEPYPPDRCRDNLLACACIAVDRGRFVRTVEEWRRLFGPRLDTLTTRISSPRWPIGMVDARLINR